MMVGYAMSRADLVIIPAQGSHLDAAEAVKAPSAGKGAGAGIPEDHPLRQFSSRAPAPPFGPRTLQSMEDEFARISIPMLGTTNP